MENYLLEIAVLFVVFICFYFYFDTKDNTNKGTDRDDSPKQHNSVPQSQNDNKTWAQSQPPFSGPNLKRYAWAQPHNKLPPNFFEQNDFDFKTWAQSQPFPPNFFQQNGFDFKNISFPPSNPRPTPQQTVQPTPNPTSRARARSKQTPTLLFSLPSPQPTPITRSKPRPEPNQQ
ncbi:hypothetical protein DICPUDRAFT_156658 [Dictyostelium purpureum]|uniref:Uncharacterized protein n=1 Tax=Dictyostelium purpureum TaxID=5786 RepID=F0ZX31_DICPU|nr:uncharacterized protein DICPUDRAFT_156658 [Dictyostelium purpureum]EGC31502.1 hypothetical protein DICPUDRAFT_156658 [Dictyostelium purpureum]|eukprot:XP_003291977.1 hypothetical protein DICPUDRAFT_156658 [Dictyostelium purpureum]